MIPVRATACFPSDSRATRPLSCADAGAFAREPSFPTGCVKTREPSSALRARSATTSDGAGADGASSTERDVGSDYVGTDSGASEVSGDRGLADRNPHAGRRQGSADLVGNTLLFG